MSPAQAITTDLVEDPYVQHCLLCRRVRWFHRRPDGPTEWEGLSGFLIHYQLPLSSLVVVDAYCETCEPFYRQLLTYGQPGQQIAEPTTSGQDRAS